MSGRTRWRRGWPACCRRRIVEHWPAPEGRDVATDYVVAERLPRTPANEQLLRMSPHPGAKQVTEGRL
jgi:hypothetical protein